MDWNSILREIILAVVGVLLTAIGGYFTALMNKHVKNEQAKETVASFRQLVRDCVLETYQVYVQEMKDNNIFNEKAQKTALSACLEQVRANMPSRVLSWLKANGKCNDGFLISQIEATIGELKNSGK